MTTIASSVPAGPAGRPVLEGEERLPRRLCGGIIVGTALSAWAAIIYTASLIF
jgi:hypothetical protein